MECSPEHLCGLDMFLGHGLFVCIKFNLMPKTRPHYFDYKDMKDCPLHSLFIFDRRLHSS